MTTIKTFEEQMKILRDSENRIPLKLEELEGIAMKVSDPEYTKPNRLPSFISRLLPECYTSFTFNNLNFKNFHEETLFFIFYAFPESEIQVQAYNELIKKGYLFSKTLNLFVLINEPKVADNKRRMVLAFIPKDWEKSSIEVLFDTPFVMGLEGSVSD
jgi:CCR4-NOT transcription complex subunit 2